MGFKMRGGSFLMKDGHFCTTCCSNPDCTGCCVYEEANPDLACLCRFPVAPNSTVTVSGVEVDAGCVEPSCYSDFNTAATCVCSGSGAICDGSGGTYLAGFKVEVTDPIDVNGTYDDPGGFLVGACGGQYHSEAVDWARTRNKCCAGDCYFTLQGAAGSWQVYAQQIVEGGVNKIRGMILSGGFNAGSAIGNYLCVFYGVVDCPTTADGYPLVIPNQISPGECLSLDLDLANPPGPNTYGNDLYCVGSGGTMTISCKAA